MVSVDNGNPKDQIEESNESKLKDLTSIEISSSQRALTSSEHTSKRIHAPSSALFNRIKFLKFGSASAKFKRLATARDQISQSVPSSSHGFRERLSGIFAEKLDWDSLKKKCQEWIRDPMNMALLVWITCVAVSGAILFLVMTGMLNSVLPKKSQRNAWFEMGTKGYL
ncbi:hypothetical protein K1719_045820 [Acacia pycnantha]|nr:hypothetical protein K1719_045820 [Acacia pycnantha]